MSLNRANSSSSLKSTTVSSQKEHVGIKCACGHDAVRLISNTKMNPDRPFYNCPHKDDGCKLFKWEDEISGPSHQTAPPTPSSSQLRSSQTTTQIPARASESSSSPVKTPWTNQTPSRPPMSMNPNKRKRSPSLSPPPSPSTTTIHGRDDVIASTSCPLSLGTDADAFSRSVANPVASTSAGGGLSDLPSPKKRARLDNASAAGSMFSDDEDLWADPALDTLLDGKRKNEEIILSSAQPLKKSVSFHELKDGGDENITDEDGVLVDTGVLRLLDFGNRRGPSPDRLINLHVRDGTSDNFPIVDDNPLNPFRIHKTPDKPGTSYTNGTPGRTPSTLASSSHAGPSSVGTLLANTSPASTNSMPTLSRLEELLPELVSALPDLRQKMAKLEKMRVADAKSNDWKSQKIRKLAEEVEELKEEVAGLRADNARLRGE